MTSAPPHAVSTLTPEVVQVIDMIRRCGPLTRSDITSRLDMGRNAVTAHLHAALDSGLIVENGHAPSTGGRAPQSWAFNHSAGFVLTAAVEVEAFHVAVTDLVGTVLDSASRTWRIQEGPDRTLNEVATELERLLKGRTGTAWGLGLSVPGPVDHVTGKPSSPPIMPGWDGFDIPDYFESRLHLPVVVDNDVNVMALGHFGLDSAESSIYVFIGTGIGAGLISHGRLHRGGRGAAGDIGHTRISQPGTTICRCGRIGCLEASAGGWAQELVATQVAASGVSPYLTSVLRDHQSISVDAIAQGVTLGDPSCIQFAASSASAIGGVLAVLVSFFNPDRIVFSGILPQKTPLFLETIERVIREQTLSLATEDLVIETSNESTVDSMRGCARMVLDLLFTKGAPLH